VCELVVVVGAADTAAEVATAIGAVSEAGNGMVGHSDFLLILYILFRVIANPMLLCVLSGIRILVGIDELEELLRFLGVVVLESLGLGWPQP